MMKCKLIRSVIFLCLGCATSISALAVTLDEARGYITASEYPKAVTAFRSLMQSPNYKKRADCNKWFGQALCMTGAYAESMPYLEFAVKQQVKGAYWYLGISRQHLYDFEGAVEAVSTYKKLLRNSPLWSAKCDSLLEECNLGLKAVEHVQDVVIIDSLVVPRKAFFAHYKLGAESGRILSPDSCKAFLATAPDIHLIGSDSLSVFESQNRDYRLVAMADAEGYHLYDSHFFNGQWSALQVIASIENEGYHLAYPFLCADGETLFFASDKTPGLGGFDLYKTHYNSEAESYYTPERLDMPFNSPYNDYMLAVDETHNVGWWATDRANNTDFVTIYLFLKPEYSQYLDGVQADRARISSIAETWKEPNGYADLVNQIMTAPQVHIEAIKTLIYIKDNRTYTSADEFVSRQACAAYEQSEAVRTQLEHLQQELKKNRAAYAKANAQGRAQLKSNILNRERKELELIQQYENLQKQYRNLEIKVL